MDVLCCYDDGAILSRDIISINLDSILDSCKVGISNIAAASVEIGQVNVLTIGSLIQTAFKNLAAIGLETDYKFKQLANANSGPSAPAAKVEAKVEKKEEKKAEVKKEEPKEEPEEDFEMGGMFD
jgi:large subunit ribosomal protein LP0